MEDRDGSSFLVRVGSLCGAGFASAAYTVSVPNFKVFRQGPADTFANRMGSVGSLLINSTATGATFGGALAGMMGGDVLAGMGKAAAGWAAGSVANMAIGHTLGYAMSGFGKPEFKDGAFYYYSTGSTPFTVGGAIIGDRDWIKYGQNFAGGEPMRTIDLHERAHFSQQTALGPSYIFAHVLSQGIGGIIGVFSGAGFRSGTHGYNIFERWWIDVPSY